MKKSKTYIMFKLVQITKWYETFAGYKQCSRLILTRINQIRPDFIPSDPRNQIDSGGTQSVAQFTNPKMFIFLLKNCNSIHLMLLLLLMIKIYKSCIFSSISKKVHWKKYFKDEDTVFCGYLTLFTLFCCILVIVS